MMKWLGLCFVGLVLCRSVGATSEIVRYRGYDTPSLFTNAEVKRAAWPCDSSGGMVACGIGNVMSVAEVPRDSPYVGGLFDEVSFRVHEPVFGCSRGDVLRFTSPKSETVRLAHGEGNVLVFLNHDTFGRGLLRAARVLRKEDVQAVLVALKRFVECFALRDDRAAFQALLRTIISAITSDTAVVSQSGLEWLLEHHTRRRRCLAEASTGDVRKLMALSQSLNLADEWRLKLALGELKHVNLSLELAQIAAVLDGVQAPRSVTAGPNSQFRHRFHTQALDELAYVLDGAGIRLRGKLSTGELLKHAEKRSPRQRRHVVKLLIDLLDEHAQELLLQQTEAGEFYFGYDVRLYSGFKGPALAQALIRQYQSREQTLRKRGRGVRGMRCFECEDQDMILRALRAVGTADAMKFVADHDRR